MFSLSTNVCHVFILSSGLKCNMTETAQLQYYLAEFPWQEMLEPVRSNRHLLRWVVPTELNTQKLSFGR